MQSIEQLLIETAINRGHGPFRRRGVTVLGRRVNDYTCTTCNMEARADRNPPPNGIDIGGPMMALNCSDRDTETQDDVSEFATEVAAQLNGDLLCPHCGADEMTDHPDGESGQCGACGRRS